MGGDCGDSNSSTEDPGPQLDEQAAVMCQVCFVPHPSNILIIFDVFRIWLIASAVTDIAIAVVLLWQLNQFKSVFRKTQRCVLIVDDWPRSDDPRSLIYCCYLASFVGLWHPQSVLER